MYEAYLRRHEAVAVRVKELDDVSERKVAIEHRLIRLAHLQNIEALSD